MLADLLLISHVSGENLNPETDFAACGVWGFAFHQKNGLPLCRKTKPGLKPLPAAVEEP